MATLQRFLEWKTGVIGVKGAAKSAYDKDEHTDAIARISKSLENNPPAHAVPKMKERLAHHQRMLKLS